VLLPKAFVRPACLAVAGLFAALLAGTALAQPAGNDWNPALVGIHSTVGVDANGAMESRVRIIGEFGEVSLVLDEKQSRTFWEDANNPGVVNHVEARKLYAQHLPQVLGASQEEWKAILPLLRKIAALRQQLAYGLAGQRARPAATEREKARATMALLLLKKDSKPEDLKAALAAVNEAEAKVTAELLKTQSDLKDLLTLKQEAYLLHLGMLD
jgi:flagellar motor switch/type III secretory pathway protein FliN